MSTKTGNMRGIIFPGAFCAMAMLVGLGTARADVASDKPGAILVFPKVVVDTGGAFTPGTQTDTEIQITNTSDRLVAARCWYVDATTVGDGGPFDCGLKLVETDFRMTLTKRQAVSFNVNTGVLNCGSPGCPAGTFPLDVQKLSNVPPVPRNPFRGELRCVQVSRDDLETPVTGCSAANGKVGDLKGEATIVTVGTAGGVDARKYNGIGIQAVVPANALPADTNGCLKPLPAGSQTLTLGGTNPVYNGCPKTLIVNHLFDDADVTSHAGDVSQTVHTDLTFVPCSDDFNQQIPGGAILQFLVFNEFEQRFSTSTRFSCFDEVQLSDIDTREGPAGNAQSIFNVNVEGTLAGQTTIRPVEGATVGNGVLAVAESFWSCDTALDTCSAAANVHFTGTTKNPDVMVLSPPKLE